MESFFDFTEKPNIATNRMIIKKYFSFINQAILYFSYRQGPPPQLFSEPAPPPPLGVMSSVVHELTTIVIRIANRAVIVLVFIIVCFV